MYIEKYLIDKDKGWKLLKRDIHRKKATLKIRTPIQRENNSLEISPKLKAVDPWILTTLDLKSPLYL